MKDFLKIFVIFFIFFVFVFAGALLAIFYDGKEFHDPIVLDENMEYEKNNENIEDIKKDENIENIEENVDEKEKDNTIKISFAGDCTLGNYDGSAYAYSFLHVLEEQSNDYAYFFKKVRPVFQNDDLTLVNLETPLTNSTEKDDKEFAFKGDPSFVNILKAGSIEMVNISNNHIYDYSQKGFLDTIENLKKSDIYYSGEGHIAYYNVKDMTIASIGYRGWGTYIKTHLKKDIKEAKEKADIVLVSFHWGDENKYYPNDVQKTLGRFAIDEGADVVVGHHPHVIQGIEKYKDKYIVYSLANFCFGGNRNPKDKDTFIFQAEFAIDNKKITNIQGNIIPCSVSSVKHVNNYQPVILEGEEKERVLNRIYYYSSGLEYGISR
ncbi:CapA family protein [Maledivibacter halophilus]|uniref:Poly-gamma-glutamate synthesis protein (Capsule biosynthesis protein) n=1 Tax=Maledivibacter halophilus TaxID=36842 RepID=A0A1T5M427_9FIRM|nr:CapA family protein [Maledivibacter halophilus]SKC82992.1 poly-gamma-glutamate synthesis protein (capsule biosynthesis protein) [Maledivibacter halophilus]